MKNFKRIAKILLVVCVMFTLIGQGVFASAAPKSKLKIAYIAKNTVDAFHATLNQAAKKSLDALVKSGKIGSWKLFDGQTDPVTQVNLLGDALNWGANLVIVLPAESAGSDPVVTKCAAKKIPCIVVNSDTKSTAKLATAFVGSNDVQAGEMMAKFVQKNLPKGGGYAHLQGVIGNSAQIARGKGLHNILDVDKKWTMLPGAEQTGEWQAEKAIKFSSDWLTKFGPKLNAIICDNDDMSSAVQATMNAAGRKDIIAIGVDGNKGPMTMIKNGELLATIFQDGAGQATKAVELAAQILSGKKVAKSTMVNFVIITKDNVSKYLK